MSFVKQTSNNNDFSSIYISETDNGLTSFENSLNSNSKFQFSIYQRTDNAIYSECVKGMWSAVKIGTLKTTKDKQFVIEFSAQRSRSYSEQIIEHIFNTWVDGVPSKLTEIDVDTNIKPILIHIIRLSYPQKWEIVNRPDEMSDVYIGNPDGSLCFTVVRFDTDYSLNEIIQESKANSEAYGMPVISCENITIKGIKCNKMVNEYDFQGVQVKTIAYTFKRANTMYSFKFGTQKNLWTKM